MTQAIGPKTRFQDLLFKHFSQGGEVALDR